MSLPILKSSENKRSVPIAVAALLLFAINFAVAFPGTGGTDSVVQYQQAISGQFTDWHPPMMALMWSLLRHVAAGPQSILAFHLISYWLGFALLADGLSRTGRWKAGWLMLASGASPLLIYNNGDISKDIGMASSFIAGFGLIFWYRIQGRRPRPAAIIAALVFIAYGTLVRHNAVFAFAPLLLYTVADPARIGAIRLIVLSCLLPVAAIPASTIINRDLIGAMPSGAEQQLLLFDLAGIAHHSGDLSVLPPAVNLSKSELDRCYTPYHFDSLAPWGSCNFFSLRLGPVSTPGGGWIMRESPGLMRMWVDAIVSHPVAYAQHRLKSFNSSINFFVPAEHCRFAPRCGTFDPKSGTTIPISAQDVRWDYIKKNALVWPVSWIVLGICMVMLLGLSPNSAQLSASRTLLISGLGYSLAYVIVGIATDFRYHYWTIMAVQTALIVAFPSLAVRIRMADRIVIVCALLLVLTVSAGLFARLTDNQSLIS